MKNKSIKMEIGNNDNAKRIFKFSKKTNLNIFAQKKNWDKVLKLNEMPNSYKDDSVILTLNNNCPLY